MTLEGRLDADVSSDGSKSAMVTFEFTVTNAGSETVTLQFTDGCKADFVVREDGREVWRFSEGRMFTQALSSETLEPDETATYKAEWTAPQPGGYIGRAELQARETACEVQTDFAITE
ncbi:hypothetical protein GS429_18555 [Natronorubrum sp. JWXQ-INN-674]|uniref:Intracellular proteinase inhibitor BsuPI domain-containing protein n=1 Tax=Natronorubrum halalkaliphilum TaxID=2691917 RepID=A0A6B0VR86_9EURY|nr:BsuPI-related putative proteinase inhibitor [Natronorubrum halalkaliphilum]MXV64028.1 hypothetical protein [Natronorubrum halalkaliphilum]